MSTYGLKVNGATVGNWDGFVINSDINTLRFLTVVHTSTTAVTAGNTYPGGGSTTGDYQTGDVVLARPDGGYGIIYTDFRDASEPIVRGSSQQYVLLRPQTNTAGSANGTTYGLLVKDSSGNVQYDSRTTVSGLDIKATKGFNSAPGNYTGGQSGDLLYTARTNSTYCLMNISTYYTIGPMDIRQGYLFPQSTTDIYWRGYSYFSWGSNNSSQGAMPNFGEIIIGDTV